MGRKVPLDIIYTTIAAPIIVADRVVEVLDSAGFTGWQTYPVELFGKDSTSIPGFQGLAVHGRCGPIENHRSNRFDKLMPGGVFPWWRGLYFEQETWDGSDIFMPSGRASRIFVVEQVKEALEKAHVRGVAFPSLDEVERAELS